MDITEKGHFVYCINLAIKMEEGYIRDVPIYVFTETPTSEDFNNVTEFWGTSLSTWTLNNLEPIISIAGEENPNCTELLKELNRFSKKITDKLGLETRTLYSQTIPHSLTMTGEVIANLCYPDMCLRSIVIATEEDQDPKEMLPCLLVFETETMDSHNNLETILDSNYSTLIDLFADVLIENIAEDEEFDELCDEVEEIIGSKPLIFPADLIEELEVDKKDL